MTEEKGELISWEYDPGRNVLTVLTVDGVEFYLGMLASLVRDAKAGGERGTTVQFWVGDGGQLKGAVVERLSD